MEPYRDEGCRFWAVTAAKGWTQATYAQLLGTTQQNVTNWKKGRHKPPYEILRRLAKLTGVPADFVISGDMRFIPPDLLPKIVEALQRAAVPDPPTIGQKRPHKRFRKRKDK